MQDLKGKFRKGNPPPPHKIDCKCFRCFPKLWSKRKPFSEETRRKISQSKTGIPSPKKGKPLGYIPKMAFKKNDPRITGENNYNWKKQGSSYAGSHLYIKKHFGNPPYCLMADNTCKGKLNWASKNYTYSRDIKDWIPLCMSHNQRYDRKNGGKTRSYEFDENLRRKEKNGRNNKNKKDNKKG